MDTKAVRVQHNRYKYRHCLFLGTRFAVDCSSDDDDDDDILDLPDDVEFISDVFLRPGAETATSLSFEGDY